MTHGQVVVFGVSPPLNGADSGGRFVLRRKTQDTSERSVEPRDRGASNGVLGTQGQIEGRPGEPGEQRPLLAGSAIKGDAFSPVTITHVAVERRGQILTGGFSGSGTSPGSRGRETDCDVRGVQPHTKLGHNKASAHSIVAHMVGPLQL